jgi:hypothetical protein
VLEGGVKEELVAAAHVGPGGTARLRAAFDVGAGGWFTVLRVENDAAGAASFEIDLVSEALTRDEAPHPFVISGSSSRRG